jgi:hypothetical protein
MNQKPSVLQVMHSVQLVLNPDKLIPMLQIFLAECVLEHQPDGGFHTEDAIFIVTLKQVEDISAAIALWCANRSMLLSLLGPAYTYPQWLAMRGYDDGIAKLAAIAMES